MIFPGFRTAIPGAEAEAATVDIESDSAYRRHHFLVVGLEDNGALHHYCTLFFISIIITLI